MIVNYLPPYIKELKYSRKEIGRIEEITLFMLLDCLHPYWYTSIGPDMIIKGHVMVYNEMHDNKYEIIDVDAFMELVDKLKKVKNRPSKKEMAHAYNLFGVVASAAKFKLSIGYEKIIDYLNDPSPFKYLIDRFKNLDRFLLWYMDTQLISVSNFHAQLFVSGWVDFRKITSLAPSGLTKQKKIEWAYKRYYRYRAVQNAGYKFKKTKRTAIIRGIRKKKLKEQRENF